MKSKLIYILIGITSLLAFQSCLMEEPDDIYKVDIDNGGGGGGSQTADFYASSTSVEPGEAVYFTNTSTDNPSSYYWDFGDGNYSFDVNPIHTYYYESNFDVSLTAYYDDGSEDTEIKYGYITVADGGGGGSYCESVGGTQDEYIQSVQIGDWSYFSGDNSGYADFTNEVVYLNSGSYEVSLTPGFNGSSFTEYWRIWIDFNGDGDFEDGDELVAQGSGTSAVSTELFIWGDYFGTTRMRISMKYNEYPLSCETFTYGEVEDYTVVLNQEKGVEIDRKKEGPAILKPVDGDYTIKLK